jgi:hypothetical protein
MESALRVTIAAVYNHYGGSADVMMSATAKRCIVFPAVACLLCMFVLTGTAEAIDLYDGKVIIHGKWSNQLLTRAEDTKSYERDYDIFNARTSLKLEVMWHVYDGPEYSMNFYSVWKQFYDGAHEIDADYRRMLEDGSNGKSAGIDQINNYDEFKDISREMFVEFTAPVFQVRLGKQIVSWGETGFERMVDTINPVDLRGDLNPAYPDFAELKRGLWMARLFFTPMDQPMDLSYELLLIPDFEPNRIWPAGYHLTHPKSFGALAYPDQIYKAYYRDAPDDDLGKPEIGIRVRGFLAGFDWTLSYFHHRIDDAILKPNAGGKVGAAAFLGTRLEDAYRYPWQDTFGFTLNRPIDVTIPIIPGTNLAMSGNIVRLEAIWEHDKPGVESLGLSPQFQPLSRITKKDRYAACLAWQTKIFLPYITPWARNKYLSSTSQLFYEIMPDKHRNDLYFPWVTYAPEKKHWWVYTQELTYELWNGRILPGFYGAYYVAERGGYFAPALGFKPQFRHTFLVRYMNYFNLSDSPADLNTKDFLTFEYTYEF